MSNNHNCQTVLAASGMNGLKNNLVMKLDSETYEGESYLVLGFSFFFLEFIPKSTFMREISPK